MRDEPADARPHRAVCSVLACTDKASLELEIDLRAEVVPLHGCLRQPRRERRHVGTTHAAPPPEFAVFGRVGGIGAVRLAIFVVALAEVREEDVEPPVEPSARAGAVRAAALA